MSTTETERMQQVVERENLQTRRSNLSTSRLLKATGELIAERGYEQTTLAEIGKRAGYSHGLVTRRFGTKAKLVEELLKRLSSGFGHESLPETLGGRVGVDALVTVIEGISQSAVKSPKSLRSFYALLFEGIRPIPALHELVKTINAEILQQLTDYTARGVDAGRLKVGVQPEDLATLTVHALRGLAYRWMLDEESVDFVAQLDILSQQIRCLADPDFNSGQP